MPAGCSFEQKQKFYYYIKEWAKIKILKIHLKGCDQYVNNCCQFQIARKCLLMFLWLMFSLLVLINFSSLFWERGLSNAAPECFFGAFRKDEILSCCLRLHLEIKNLFFFWFLLSFFVIFTWFQDTVLHTK